MIKFHILVQALKAAGEVTRLRLLALLANGELSVKDLTDILGQSQPRVSRHLKLLSEAGLVMRNVEGAWVFYRVCDTGDAGALIKALLGQCDLDDEIILNDRLALEKIHAANKSRADEYFSQVAKRWDEERKFHVPESAVEEAILRMVGPYKVERLLDLGTGTGRMLELLADKYVVGVGIDSSREMIAVARAKFNEAKIAHAKVKLGDILTPETGEASADMIVIHQVLHYFADPGLILNEVQKRLSAGGRILVVDFAPHGLEFLREEYAHLRLGLSEQQMQAWTKNAGLNIDAFESHINQAKQDGLMVCLWLLSKTKGNS